MQGFKSLTMLRIIPLALLLLIMVGCKDKQQENVGPIIEKEPYYQETYRPQYHFSPPEKWMNDPNGLVYNEGIYHLFYQYYPDDIVWGPMHWGHAISKDMIHWDHKPIALYPDENGLIFSGSAVVDKSNTSGFAKNGETPLVAMYTYHLMKGEQEGRKDFQTQGIAYSLDNGETWTKYEGNPVIGNNGIKDFRDPKVFWHTESETWIMALVAGDHAKFYRSDDLKDWKHISDFGKEYGAHGGVWECPDLFPLKVQDMEEEKWVLIISINPGAPNGGSGTQYFIGDFDGTRFTTDQKEAKWLDYGTDNYAGVTYNNTPNDRRIFIGWMSNWDYARDTPTEKWRSAMTLPRELKLKKIEDDYKLVNLPLDEVGALGDSELLAAITIPYGQSQNFKLEGLDQSKISFKTKSKDFKLIFANDLNEKVVFNMDSSTNSLVLDRSKSGEVGFQEEFGNKQHYAPAGPLTKTEIPVSIFLDWSSIEIFVDEGLIALTDQVFPSEPYNQLRIENNDSQHSITDITVQKMKSVW